MSDRPFLEFLEAETKNLRHAGLLRPELELSTPQGPVVKINDQELVNFASSDYLGFSNHPEMKQAATEAIGTWGVGLASPRMAAGTSALHTRLERTIATFLGTGDALVYASGHHANTGLFESLLGARDYVFCDEMIRASLADGIRLCRARAYAYRNSDMEHLEDRLKRSRGARFRIIATDAVFPVTGEIAKLKEIYALAAKYQALVVVDDSEGIGVLGADGEGTHALLGVRDQADLVTGSFGHALGGGAGGFVAGRTSVVAWLRQKSRPHLASTSLAPASVATALKALELVRREPSHLRVLGENLQTLNDALAKDAGFSVRTTHPAISVLIRNAVAAQRLADFLYRRGIFVIGYCHPVVPEGQARVCLRVTARHRKEDLVSIAVAIGEAMKTLKISF